MGDISILDLPVLVLNENYEPLNVCRARRAIVLLWRGKAEVLENDSVVIHSPSCSLTLPSVIRLSHLIKRPYHQRKLTRQEVFLRDNFTCQYCGKKTRELTLDHVIPRHLGGGHTWDNLVSACKACNYRKAGRHPKDAALKLLRRPSPPPAVNHYLIRQRPDARPEWQKYDWQA